MFVSGIQFMEFLFWIDLHNKIGINKVVTIIGSLFNIGQPLSIYIIKTLVLHLRALKMRVAKSLSADENAPEWAFSSAERFNTRVTSELGYNSKFVVSGQFTICIFTVPI